MTRIFCLPIFICPLFALQNHPPLSRLLFLAFLQPAFKQKKFFLFLRSSFFNFKRTFLLLYNFS
ncbi:unnamed protein product [Meloidogyne enterolobii]|uniref:Uncharacterized protein n=1 Tax=Meloidogyne enterolobii TaxID=390850 RepID=A0ACB1AZ23_MELEN